VAGGSEGLRLIVDNLVTNACQGDGTRAAGRVDVTAAEGDGGADLALRVADDGPGFTPTQLACGIGPLASSKAAGTGLGLYIAARLAEASGGSLEPRNRAAGGAEVVVRLPRAEASAAAAALGTKAAS
jgi:C4-dicarboxylate-specific signal transduction histidine kinase